MKKSYEFAYRTDAPAEANVGILVITDVLGLEDAYDTANEKIRETIEEQGGDSAGITTTLELRNISYYDESADEETEEATEE